MPECNECEDRDVVDYRSYGRDPGFGTCSSHGHVDVADEPAVE